MPDNGDMNQAAARLAAEHTARSAVARLAKEAQRLAEAADAATGLSMLDLARLTTAAHCTSTSLMVATRALRERTKKARA